MMPILQGLSRVRSHCSEYIQPCAHDSRTALSSHCLSFEPLSSDDNGKKCPTDNFQITAREVPVSKSYNRAPLPRDKFSLKLMHRDA